MAPPPGGDLSVRVLDTVTRTGTPYAPKFFTAHEWETVEYVADAVAARQRKALIIVGHIPSEQAGMQEFARWLEPLVKGTPVTFVAAKDPFWSPR